MRRKEKEDSAKEKEERRRGDRSCVAVVLARDFLRLHRSFVFEVRGVSHYKGLYNDWYEGG